MFAKMKKTLKFSQILSVFFFMHFTFITAFHSNYHLNSVDEPLMSDFSSENLISTPKKLLSTSEGSSSDPDAKSSVTYVPASIPLRLLQCMEKLSILRCMKVFVLQRMEAGDKNGDKLSTPHRDGGDLTKEFLAKILASGKKLPSLVDKKYTRLNDSELTERLISSFQEFFQDRDFRLHFIPGVMVKVMSNKENTINWKINKNHNYVEGRGRGQHKHYKYLMQLGVPVLMMPAIILGSFLPFILPAIKMATFMTYIMNNGALLAALMYAARTAALHSESQAVNYTHPGYH